LLLHDRCAHQGFLELHHQIDILLDPFPYNGGVTSLDGLWMGVPLVTLAGRLPVSRAGATILISLGLSELIAHSAAEYVEIASRLAADMSKLSELRAGMRARMRQSPLMDRTSFTRGLESLYRTAWQKWCVSGH
jgi:predicted O-linked N-acetylglucosamine transferase (SPINDLY family)